MIFVWNDVNSLSNSTINSRRISLLTSALIFQIDKTCMAFDHVAIRLSLPYQNINAASKRL